MVSSHMITGQRPDLVFNFTHEPGQTVDNATTDTQGRPDESDRTEHIA